VADEQLPAPLSSPDCDLRGLEWMPLDVLRLTESDLFLESSGDGFKAAVALWCKSWRQVPAGSVPAGDDKLAQLAQVTPARWKRIKAEALRNWVLCSDGRLYHPVVAQKAMEALPHRQEFVEKKTADAERKARERKDRAELFSQLKAHGITLPWDTKTSELRERAKALLQREEPPAPPPAAGADQGGESAPPVTQNGVTGHVTGHEGVTAKTGTPPDTTGTTVLNPSGSLGADAPAPTPTPAPTPAPPAPKKGAKPVEPQADEPLEGDRQRSSRPYRQCPKTFRLTGPMVKWANDEYPILDLDEIRRETRAFLNHRYDRGYVEWVGAWENWIKKAATDKTRFARPATTFQTERQRQAQAFAPTVAARSGPPPRVIDTTEASDVEPRPLAVRHG
jgi:uncharacterized protein YdaU (DUF1376 family)